VAGPASFSNFGEIVSGPVDFSEFRESIVSLITSVGISVGSEEPEQGYVVL